MHHYDGGCGRCGRHKGEFLGSLPYSILSFREDVVRTKFAWILKPGRKLTGTTSGAIHLCAKCRDLWVSSVRVNWRKLLKEEEMSG